MNPATGTFISMDTYQGSTFDPITLHKYLYANANPVMNCDPSGYSATYAEHNVVMAIQGILEGAWRVASNSAFNLGMKIISSLNQIIITATPVVMLLGNNPAFIDLCDRVARGEINPVQLAEQIKDEIVKAADSFKEKFSNSSSGDPGNFDPDDWHKIAEELQKNNTDVSRWNKGSFDSAYDSLAKHYQKHGSKVGATSPEQYLRKAEGFANNLRGSTKHYVDGAVDGVMRYIKNGKYIDLAPDGTIVSFGSSR